MTLPVVPGNSMSFSQINTELGLSSTATISLNDAAVRTLAGVGASPATIAITNLSGKSNEFAFTISSGQTNANLRTLAVNAGWNQSTKVAATIGSGIYISSNSTGTAALTVNGSFPGGVSLVNNGFIVGMGGAGGNGAGATNSPTATAGSAAGLALAVSTAITITNASGTIAGGGGGGGGGGPAQLENCGTGYLAGGGGGGGRSSNAANSSGGSGGSPSSQGLSPGVVTPSQAGGAGTVSSAGTGGNGAFWSGTGGGGTGGTGGGWGSAGSAGQTTFAPHGSGGAGGAAGGCITGNSNITYVSTGTRLGSIS
jgi:hypothetical protein